MMRVIEIKKGLVLVVAFVFLCVSFFNTSIASAEEANQVKLDQSTFYKNGRLMKSLDASQLKNAFEETDFSLRGTLWENKPNRKEHRFDDGSSIVVTSSVNSSSPFSVYPEATDGGSGGGAVRDVTAFTTYNAYSWTGMKMWSYTLYQKAKVNGSSVTWYEPIPYSSFDTTLLSWWTIGSEALGVGYQPGGNYSIMAMSSLKLSFSVAEIVGVQTWNLKGTLVIHSTGSYVGNWERLY